MHARARAPIMRVSRYVLVYFVLYAFVILQQAIPHVSMILFGNKTVLTNCNDRRRPTDMPAMLPIAPQLLTEATPDISKIQTNVVRSN